MTAPAPSVTPPPASPARALLPFVLPALVIGVGSSLLLIGVSEAADLLKNVLWQTLPDAIGVGRWSVAWMLAVLTATGVAVGLVVWKVYGHAGPDPATTGLVDAPLPPGVVPGLLLATALALAGGVSLGPENPITAANIALAYWLGRRLSPGSPATVWVALGAAGTVGALFGTPIAAVLILTESMVSAPRPVPAVPGGRAPTLWDQLFAPLIAAGAGGLTSSLLAAPAFGLPLPPFSHPRWPDLVAALVIATAGAAVALVAVYAFPYVHRFFHLLPHPVLALSLGGVVLGLLGALGGRLTLFKGLEEIGELASDVAAYSAGSLALMCVVKLAAVLVACGSGFRGGRIFPSVFAGVALGFTATALVPSVHPAVAVTCGVLGVLLAVTRQGWVSLFTAAILAPDPGLLPLLCVALLPAWLLVSGRPQMQLDGTGAPLR
ncbi:ion channel protein [Streptomyces subrutilus]|uniref:Ion channel protein n=1 Tax=Streptomyces subrutilus TaxID=36818 RepID=A0A5P2US89_9ACTN|nr:ion channel protein [Streptomyces subrutilus]QEU82018.1 ion channel protein [Streptomyces subrutilus]WSJ28522.1 ion channel protein [Streptomyces subrutilus]